MGSSTRKKSNKKADFQKPKLKVGKARPKPANFTDTSFKSKGISLAHQSITTTAPTLSDQFAHNISLLTSRSDPQRRDALASLTRALHTLSPTSALPLPLSLLLPCLSPLLLDGSSSVRAQLLKLLRVISAPERTWKDDINPYVEKFLLYVRAGMTHLAAGIRETAAEAWIWALEVAGEESVSCAGGWIKGCKTLCVVLGWPVVLPQGDEGGAQKKNMDSKSGGGGGGWSNVSASAGHGATKAGTQPVALLNLLALFLSTGLVEQQAAPSDFSRGGENQNGWSWMLTHTKTHMLPKRSNAYGYLNIFGEPRDEEGECYRDCDERQSVFQRMGFEDAFARGLETLRKEGGEVGRLGSRVEKVLKGRMGALQR